MNILSKAVILTLAAIAFFSGCSNASLYRANPADKHSYDTEKIKDAKLIQIAAFSNKVTAWTPGSDGADSAYYVFQKAAEKTLQDGNKYFSIYRPIVISDFENKGFKSEELLIKECIDDNIPTVTAVTKYTRYGMNYCGTTQYLSSFLEIVEYKEKPSSLNSYDAQVIVDALKTRGNYIETETLWNNEYWEWMKAIPQEGYDVWFKVKRSDPTLFKSEEQGR